MVRLITFDQALGHLRLSIAEASPPTPAEADLRLKIEQAEALVLDYVRQRRVDGDLWDSTVASWDVAADAPPPALVTAAVLIQLGDLHRFRGDDGDTTRVGATLHPRAEAYLDRLRDGAVA